jgi:hypothetical protein
LASGSGDVFTTIGLIDQPDSVVAYLKFNGDGTVSRTKFSDFRNRIETEYQVASGSYTLNADPDAAGSMWCVKPQYFCGNKQYSHRSFARTRTKACVAASTVSRDPPSVGV